MLEQLEFSDSFQGRVFRGKIWGRSAGCVTFLSLAGGEVRGWCFRNLSHQPSCSDRSGVHVLVGIIELNFFLLVGILVFGKQLKDIVMYIP